MVKRNNGNGRTGRPRIEIDFKELQKLCQWQATEEEIADWFGCSVDTIERRIREQYKMTFAEFFKRYKSFGKISLRRTMFRLAEKSANMAKFLAKNHLGMTDTHEIANAPGETLRIEHSAREKFTSLLDRLASQDSQAESDSKDDREPD